VDAATKQQVAGEIEFRAFTGEDLGEISRLITGMSGDDEALHLRDKSGAYYRWMYYGNPAGPAFGFLGRHGDRIVSSFAVAPKVMQVGGRQVRVGKTMDMFTDPDYQGMGLIKQCAERVFAAAREAGIDGWYVTPSVNSYPIFKGKWGYREDFELVYRARVVDLEAVLVAVRPGVGRWVGRIADRLLGPLLRRAPKLPAGWSVTELTRFDERTDALWAEVAGGYGVAIVRDAAYMNWRYVDNPDDYVVLGLGRDGALRGIVVLKTTRRQALTVGEIVDLVCAADDPATFRLLVRVAVDRCRELGCALVQTWSIRGTRLDHQFVRAGVAIRRTRVRFLISPDYPDSLIYDKDAWLLTQGDGNDV
jgi:GNAT superfamily N-acetyltransferase